MKLDEDEMIQRKQENCSVIGVPREKQTERVIEKYMRKTTKKGSIYLTNKRVICETQVLFKSEPHYIEFEKIKYIDIARDAQALKRKLSQMISGEVASSLMVTLVNPLAGLLYKATAKIKKIDNMGKIHLDEAEKFLGGYGYLFITFQGLKGVETTVVGPIPNVKLWKQDIERRLKKTSGKEKCQYCGAELKGKKIFCTECGKEQEGN